MTTSINPTSVISLPRTRKAMAAVNSLPIFYEDWADDFLDGSKWTYTVTSSGSVAVHSSFGGDNGLLDTALLSSGATSGGALNLTSRKPFVLTPIGGGNGITAAGSLLQKTSIEFSLIVETVARMQNTAVFWGVSATQGATKTTNNSLGWYLGTDVLRAFSDRSGVETTSALTSAPTLTTLHKCRIDLTGARGAEFFVDDALQASITANLPGGNGGMYLAFHTENDQAAIAQVWLGTVRVWMEDIV